MKSTQYFSFSKSPISFKPTVCSATRRRILPTTTAKSSPDSANDQSSSHVTATYSLSKIVGSQSAGQDLVVPRLERLGSCPSTAKMTGSLMARIWPLPSQGFGNQSSSHVTATRSPSKTAGS